MLRLQLHSPFCSDVAVPCFVGVDNPSHFLQAATRDSFHPSADVAEKSYGVDTPLRPFQRQVVLKIHLSLMVNACDSLFLDPSCPPDCGMDDPGGK